MPMEEAERTTKKGWAALAIEAKAGVVIFGIIGVLGLVFSGFFLMQHIHEPFNIDYQGEAYVSLSEREAQEIAFQKAADTDGDGISDYDELNVYRTSPYLMDSDSDGFDDGQEIKSGDNPNCPAGEDCNFGSDAAINSPLAASDLTDDLPFEDPGLGGTIETEEDLANFLNQLTTEDIRAALVAQGIDQATVDALSDDEVRGLFDTALKELQASGAISSILNQ